MKTCETCKHWGEATSGFFREWGGEPGCGLLCCGLLSDVDPCNDGNDRRTPLVSLCSYESAAVYTRAEFGCGLHQERQAESADSRTQEG
jgi:hypothetical protein